MSQPRGQALKDGKGKWLAVRELARKEDCTCVTPESSRRMLKEKGLPVNCLQRHHHATDSYHPHVLLSASCSRVRTVAFYMNHQSTTHTIANPEPDHSSRNTHLFTLINQCDVGKRLLLTITVLCYAVY